MSNRSPNHPMTEFDMKMACFEIKNRRIAIEHAKKFVDAAAARKAVLDKEAQDIKDAVNLLKSGKIKL